MARARLVKPDFFTSEQVCQVSLAARLLFIGLWTLADVEGRLVDSPWRIKLALFPSDQIDTESLLTELALVGLIRRYDSLGRQFLDIPTFTNHQHFHPQERLKGSKLPEFTAFRVGQECSEKFRTIPEEKGAKPAGSSGSSRTKRISGARQNAAPVNGNGRNGTPIETWLTPFGKIWEQAYGGEMNYGEAAAALSKPIKQRGEAEVLARFRTYCAKTAPAFASVMKFSRTVGGYKPQSAQPDERPFVC